MNPKTPPTAPPGSFPPKAPHARLEFRAMLLPLYTHVSRPFGTRQPFSRTRHRAPAMTAQASPRPCRICGKAIAWSSGGSTG
jgi:hypothetical protein